MSPVSDGRCRSGRQEACCCGGLVLLWHPHPPQPTLSALRRRSHVRGADRAGRRPATGRLPRQASHARAAGGRDRAAAAARQPGAEGWAPPHSMQAAAEMPRCHAMLTLLLHACPLPRLDARSLAPPSSAGAAAAAPRPRPRMQLPQQVLARRRAASAAPPAWSASSSSCSTWPQHAGTGRQQASSHACT